jgi:ribosomal protein L11 methyltransferase
MSWILIRADFDPCPLDLSPFVEIFREFGVENTLEDANGLQGCLVALPGTEHLPQELRAALLNGGAAAVSVSPYVEQDWETTWRQFFRPRRVGSHFLVVPTWEVQEPQEGDLVLLLDPGQAFGTGDHPTTRMCLELLEDLPLVGKRLADVGCGSGILAIGASKLGASVLAVDIDPVALEVTRENAERNGAPLDLYCGDGLNRLDSIPSQVELKAVPQDDSPLSDDTAEVASPLPEGSQFDVVVSNIISATLIRLGRQLTEALEPGGHWIVSGIIEQNWPEVKAAALAMNMVLVRNLVEDGWVAATFIKNADEPV